MFWIGTQPVLSENTFLYSNSHVTFVSCMNMLLWRLKSWWPTAIYFPLLLTLTDLLSDRLMFVKAQNLNSILCVIEHMIYSTLNFHWFDTMCIVKIEKGCIWILKSSNACGLQRASRFIIHGQEVSVVLLGNDCLSFYAVYKRGFAGSKQELQQQIYHEYVALINPSSASVKRCRLCVSAGFELGRDSFFKVD